MSTMVTTEGPRLTWPSLPSEVRAHVEEILGERVVNSESQVGGFSPGTADRIVTESGNRAFVKAASADLNRDTPRLHRREAAVCAQFPSSAHLPRLLGTFDDGTWIALVLEDVPGRHPQTPWSTKELDLVLRALTDVTEHLAGAALVGLPRAADDFAKELAGWERIIADVPADLDPWVVRRLPALAHMAGVGLHALEGGAVVHSDLRADNILIRDDDTVVFVDWPWASTGAAWLDRLFLLQNVNLFGGHDVEKLASVYLPDAPASDVSAVLAGFVGYFIDVARRPDPDGIPTLREFQRVQGDAGLRWLARRMERADEL